MAAHWGPYRESFLEYYTNGEPGDVTHYVYTAVTLLVISKSVCVCVCVILAGTQQQLTTHSSTHFRFTRSFLLCVYVSLHDRCAKQLWKRIERQM